MELNFIPSMVILLCSVIFYIIGVLQSKYPEPKINPIYDLRVIIITLFGLAGLLFIRVEIAIYKNFKP